MNISSSNWKKEKLGDVVKFIGGGTPSKSREEYWNGNIPWTTVKDFNGQYLTSTLDRITSQGLKNSSSKLAKSNELLLVTRISPGLATIAKIDTAINQDIKIVRPYNNIDIKYLYLYFKSIQHHIESISSGATVKGITIEKLNNLSISLPPIKEQKRIAAILDKAQELINDRQKAIDKLSLLQKVQFENFFGNPGTNKNNYLAETIGDLTETTNYGTSKKAHETDGFYPCLRMNNITYDGDWNLDELKYIDLEEKELNRYLVFKGDLLFNRTNSRELVGKTAVFQEDEPMAFAGYLIRLRTNKRGLTEYIAGYLNSLHGKAVLQNMCKNIVGMANINAKELQSIKILVPPIEVQNQYVQFITRLRDEKKRMKNSLQEFENLYQSLLQRAFKGELTRQKVG